MDFLRGLDVGLFTFINSTLSHPWLDQFFPLITDLQKTLPFEIVVPILVLFGFWRSHQRKAFLVFLGLLLALGFTDWSSTALIKNQIQRARPFETEGVTAIQRSPAGGYSFPSNHSANMFALSTYITAFLPEWSPFLYAIAALVAYSRVYCGVHFPADVIAGALWGIFWGFLFSRGALKVLRIHRGRA